MPKIQDLKFTPEEFAGRGISGQPDRVEGQAKYIKAKFDEIAKDMIALGKWNELIDELIPVVQKLDAAVAAQAGQASRISSAELEVSNIKNGPSVVAYVGRMVAGDKPSVTNPSAEGFFHIGTDANSFYFYLNGGKSTKAAVGIKMVINGVGWVNPTVSAGDFVKVSSARFKRNIAGYDGALDKILDLDICGYDFDDGTQNGRPEIGLIADATGTPPEIVADIGAMDGETQPVKGISLSSYASLIARALQEHYDKREAEITAAQLALCEAYEEMQEQYTRMQLALCEAYEELTGGI